MSAPASKSSGTGPTGGVLVYVVDDEPMLLELAQVILEPAGYELETFRSPREAVQSYKGAKRRPALIITDYAMRSMNGMDLLDACRAVDPDQKILLVSGTVGADIFAQSASKPNRFLAKPYHARELIAAVNSTLAE